MHKCFHNIFADPKNLTPLKYIGSQKDKRWDEGILQNEKSNYTFPVHSGIPEFIKPSEDPWADEDLDNFESQYGINKDVLIATNWKQAMASWSETHLHYKWIRHIVEDGGLILEVACGPGGGFAPYILDLNPHAHILMSDIGLFIVQQWKNFNANNRSHEVSFANFDMTNCPIISNSFDCIDSAEGISNIQGNHLAIKEAYRILKPGGKLFMCDSALDSNSFSQFPEKIQVEWRIKDPDIGKGYENRLKKAGFQILHYKKGEKYVLKSDGTIGRIAMKHAITMYSFRFTIEAQKPL